MGRRERRRLQRRLRRTPQPAGGARTVHDGWCDLLCVERGLRVRDLPARVRQGDVLHGLDQRADRHPHRAVIQHYVLTLSDMKCILPNSKKKKKKKNSAVIPPLKKKKKKKK